MSLDDNLGEFSFYFVDTKNHKRALPFALLIFPRGCTAWGESLGDYDKNEEADEFGGSSSKMRRGLEGLKTL